MTTQLDCSIGLKKEVTYGTAITVDNFLEFSSEGLDRQPEFAQGNGLHPGNRVALAGHRSLAKEAAGGSISLDAPTKGLGAILEAAFGVVTNTAVPTQTGVFQQVHTPAVTDYLSSYTIQKGIPTLGGGATTPHTFPGSVCKSLEVSVKEGALVEIKTDWGSKEVLTATAYAAPSYPVGLDVFTFVHGAITIGGTVTMPTTTAIASGGTAVANVTEADVKWDNGLDGGGYTLGGAGKRTRKPAVGLAAITGSLTAEYNSTTLRDAYLAQTALALVLTFTHTSVIGTSAHPILQIVVPNLQLEGDIPKSNGGNVVTQNIPWTGLDAQVSGVSPVYFVYVSTDTAP